MTGRKRSPAIRGRRVAAWLAVLAAAWSCAVPASGQAAESDATRIVFIAGGASHGYGEHEHYAGSKLLADALQQLPGVRCDVVRNGWPADDSLLDEADAIVIYADGGHGHPAVAHLDRLGQLMEQGKGLVCLHYGVEVPRGPIGDRFLGWLGGYFETDWSVNPHWRANYDEMVDHPVTRGVPPFQAQDEWYYHMRFPKSLSGVQPILTALPPDETLSRPDGPHSGNPHVRAAVARGERQHMAWAFERPQGGRSFGFTGGHFHWNWGRPEVRKLVANAILWTAGIDPPGDGVPTAPLSFEELQANQDFTPPDNLDRAAIVRQFGLTEPN